MADPNRLLLENSSTLTHAHSVRRPDEFQLVHNADPNKHSNYSIKVDYKPDGRHSFSLVTDLGADGKLETPLDIHSSIETRSSPPSIAYSFKDGSSLRVGMDGKLTNVQIDGLGSFHAISPNSIRDQVLNHGRRPLPEEDMNHHNEELKARTLPGLPRPGQ